jgi:F0F1-type ATP synthase assembly protein I
VTTEPRGSQGGPSGTSRRPAEGLGAEASRGMNQASRGHAVAFGFVGVVLLFFFAGRLLDKWLGTEPWLQVVGSVAGWVLGVVVVYYMTQRSLD